MFIKLDSNMGEKLTDTQGNTYITISVRGTNFAPRKRIHMVLPPDVQTPVQLEEFIDQSDVKEVHQIALEGLRLTTDS